MRDPDLYPSVKQAVAQVLSTSQQALSVDDLFYQVNHSYKAASWTRSEIDQTLKHLFQAVPTPSGQYEWLSNLLTGNIFRHPLSKEEIRRGVLLLDELEHTLFFPSFFESHHTERRTLQIEFFGGRTIEAQVGVDRKMWSLSMGTAFTEWVKMSGGQSNDDILITVHDAAAGQYSLRLQPHEMRAAEELQNKKIHLAILAEEIVIGYQYFQNAMPTWDLAAHLIARGFYRDTVPADDLHLALHYYSLLHFEQGEGYSLKAPSRNLRPGDEFEARKRELFAPDRYRQDSAPKDLKSNGQTEDLDINQTYSTSDWEEYFDEDESEYFDIAEAISDFGWPDDSQEGVCENYAAYLNCFHEVEEFVEPLSHNDFHLLEAELAMLISLEMEFSYLLADQLSRKNELAEMLYIDPDSLLDDFDIPGSDFFDDDDIPF